MTIRKTRCYLYEGLWLILGIVSFGRQSCFMDEHYSTDKRPNNGGEWDLITLWPGNVFFLAIACPLKINPRIHMKIAQRRQSTLQLMVKCYVAM